MSTGAGRKKTMLADANLNAYKPCVRLFDAPKSLQHSTQTVQHHRLPTIILLLHESFVANAMDSTHPSNGVTMRQAWRAFRQRRDVVAEEGRFSLNELLRRAQIHWHGVALKAPLVEQTTYVVQPRSVVVLALALQAAARAPSH